MSNVQSLLLRPHGRNWVYPHRPARRDVRGQDGDDAYEDANGGECQWVGGLHLEEHGAHQPRENEGTEQANDGTGGDGWRALARNDVDDCARAGTKCSSNTDVSGPLRNSEA